MTVVDQKFMTVSHSYLPSDRDVGSIETESCKRNTIFVPEEWSELNLKSRRKNAFIVTNMAHADFVSLELVFKPNQKESVKCLTGEIGCLWTLASHNLC